MRMLKLVCSGLLLAATMQAIGQSIAPADVQKVKTEALPAGAFLPDAPLVDADGKVVNLSAYKGKTLIIDVWATWCKPCLQYMPQIDSLYKTVKSQGAEMLAICTGDDKARFDSYIAKNRSRIAAKLLFDPKGKKPDSLSFRTRLGINAYPTTMVVDSNGIVRGYGINHTEIGIYLSKSGIAVKGLEEELKASGANEAGQSYAMGGGVGTALPSFALTTASGSGIHTNSFKGKVTILDFWATWCGPCRAITHQLDSAFKTFHDSSFQMIGINYRENQVPGDPVAYWKKKGYEFPTTLNSDAFGKALNAGNPTLMLIDKEGMIRGRWDGASDNVIGELYAAVQTAVKENKKIKLQDAIDANRNKEYEKGLELVKWVEQSGGGGEEPFDLTYVTFESLMHINEPEALLVAQDWRTAFQDNMDVLSSLGDLIAQGKGMSPAMYRYGTIVFEKMIAKALPDTDYMIVYDLAGRCYFLSGDTKTALSYAEKSLANAKSRENIAPATLEYLEGVLKKYKESL